MKKLITVCALFLLSGSLVYSQLLIENFSYTSGDSITTAGSNWITIQYPYTTPLLISTGSLSYSGYGSSGIGNAANPICGSNRQDAGKIFDASAITSGNLYAAFLVKVNSIGTDSDNDGYFLNLMEGTGLNNYCRVSAIDATGGNIQFGIQRNSGTGAARTLTTNTYSNGGNPVFLIVLKYNFSTETASIYVNPSLSGVEPVTPDASNNTGTSFSQLQRVQLRQGGDAGDYDVTIDGIRIAQNWSDAIGGGSTANQPPSISGLTRDPWIPVNEATIGATVTDDHTVTDVKMYYTVNAITDSTPMTNTSGNSYETEMPGQAAGTYVTYFIKAVDDSGAVTTTGLQKYFAGTTNISALRVNDGNGLSIYNGVPVRVRGIVTAGDSTYSASNVDIYIQDGTSGINIFNSGWAAYPEGTDLTIEGSVENYNGKLRFNAPTITNNGTGTIPTPTVISATQLETETYEGMLVTVTGLTFNATGIFDSTGQLRFGGTSYYCNGTDSITIYLDRQLWDEFHGFAIPAGSINVRGIATQYDPSNPFISGYELLPRKTADINVGGVSVPDNNPINPKEFGLGQNYPNPFNPNTTISYEVPKASDISIKIYNLLGQEIRTLFSGKQNAGKHVMNWDGKDNIGKAVSTGIYFYRLNAPNFVQTRKMIMIK